MTLLTLRKFLLMSMRTASSPKKSGEVSIKTRSTLVSCSFNDQVTRHICSVVPYNHSFLETKGVFDNNYQKCTVRATTS